VSSESGTGFEFNDIATCRAVDRSLQIAITFH
jgi:hypothetical protein